MPYRGSITIAEGIAMAKLMLPPGGDLPQSRNRRRLVQFLLDNLPSASAVRSGERFLNLDSEYLVIPDIAFQDAEGTHVLKADVLVVTPHCVYLIEFGDADPHLEESQFRDHCSFSDDDARNLFVRLKEKCSDLRRLISAASTEGFERVLFQGIVFKSGGEVLLDLTGNCRGTPYPLGNILIEYLTSPGLLPSGTVTAGEDSSSICSRLVETLLAKGKPANEPPRCRPPDDFGGRMPARHYVDAAAGSLESSMPRSSPLPATLIPTALPGCSDRDIQQETALRRAFTLFQNRRLQEGIESHKKITRKDLINALNYVHFQDESILLNFRHKKYHSILSVQARPRPCMGERLDCILIGKSEGALDDLSYEFAHLLFADGCDVILVIPQPVKSEAQGCMSFILPGEGYRISLRSVERHRCRDIDAELIQEGVVFKGVLVEYSGVSFRIEVVAEPPQSFLWVNPDVAVTVLFRSAQGIVFSGECEIIRQGHGQHARAFALRPVKDRIHRFRPKEFRSRRHKVVPSPSLIFRHPLTAGFVSLELDDISGSGFSAVEYYGHSLLMTGLILPEAEIEIASGCRVRCKAQVVYRNPVEQCEDGRYVKCGVAVLDMDMKDQVRLSSVLHRLADERSFVCNRVDMDQLWRFFFETGFFYPKKYALIHEKKERLKRTYEKLYIESPEIARHFIYQEKGRISGHISMVRFHENTWLFHHHAATGSGFRKSGIVVLEQIGRYVNDFARLYSTHMHFIVSYFRPENRFPDRVFGGFARHLDDPEGASVSPFAYFHLPDDASPESWDNPDMEPEIEVAESSGRDLIELESCFGSETALLFHALDLKPDMLNVDTLTAEYRRAGFTRMRKVLSVRKAGRLRAVVLMTASDIGLNLSNLTNCMHVIVLDGEDFPARELLPALFSAKRKMQCYGSENVPVLLYPVRYAESQSLAYDKIYRLWAFNTLYSDRYFQYMESLVSRSRRKPGDGSAQPAES